MTASGCSLATGGSISSSDVEIICGIPPELFQELKEEFDAATQGLKERTQEQKELLALLREKLSLNERQVAAAFQAAGEIDVVPERYGEKLVEIAQRYAALKEELDARPGDDPEIAAKKQEAARALEDGDMDLADQLLDAVIALEDQALDQRALEAAATRAQKAGRPAHRLARADPWRSGQPGGPQALARIGWECGGRIIRALTDTDPLVSEATVRGGPRIRWFTDRTGRIVHIERVEGQDDG
ncbi:hypothetical protein M2324_003799 [Rhodovulum sulfidophilum]|nr:hypothetical protein [Rhodovulum sulfidophilum]